MATEARQAETPALSALREQLLLAAQAFATEQQPLSALLTAMVADVARASAEPLPVFPVAHHSPASALHMLRRLRGGPAPKVIFIELCEDLREVVPKLADCKLPVALQAFAQDGVGFPGTWSPLSVVAPLTEFSAEYQAIAYALQSPGTELVFCDRSVDHVFQFLPQEEGALEERVAHEEEQDSTPLGPGEEEEKPLSHGSALGLQIGGLEPTFDAFLQVLLRNARVRHFAEWWDQYVEQAILGADEDTYRHVMYLVGSLLRRLGRRPEDHESDRRRERYMWTRMKEYLRERGVAPQEALYICGAIHAVSDVEEFGSGSAAVWDIPARTKTKWLYGLVPSSFAAIERQFHHPAGTVSLAEGTWQKGLSSQGLQPLRLQKEAKPKKLTKAAAAAAATAAAATAAATAPEAAEAAEATAVEGAAVPAAAPVKGRGKKKAAAVAAPVAAATPAADEGGPGMLRFLTRPPELQQQDEEQLLHWCVEVVRLARKNGYLSSSADAIAIYQTSVLLAGLRNRRHPSPYDFQDAAVTCLEKDRVAKRRDVRRLCEILLGGDRIGQVGYDSLPPLGQDVYDRLAALKKLNVNLQATTVQRALMDFAKDPALRSCSDLLWTLRYLLGDLVRPIMGERVLGKEGQQESWDITIGKNQGRLIELGYEGVTVEHVLERRLKAKAYGDKAHTVAALTAAEDAVLYLRSGRLVEELGLRSVELLRQETGATDAPEIDERVRRLVHYYRATPDGLPEWLRQFVVTGYAHFTTLLPAVFEDQGQSPAQVASMLAFLLTQESLALSLGCQRSQLLIAVGQAGPVTTDPTKLGLLWATEWMLGQRTDEQIRSYLDQALENPLMLPVFPSYVGGFLLALKFTTLVARLVVELLSKAFERLPDELLMPWLPGLLVALRPYAGEVMPALLKEASACYPANLMALGGWTPPWQAGGADSGAAGGAGEPTEPTGDEAVVAALLKGSPAVLEALAALL